VEKLVFFRIAAAARLVVVVIVIVRSRARLLCLMSGE
jgi:hypothetical protein